MYYVMSSARQSFINSIIYSFHCYSASSSPLLRKSAPDTAQILCRSFTPKRAGNCELRTCRKVTTWRLERNSNPRPFGRKASTLLMRHHVPQTNIVNIVSLCSALLDRQNPDRVPFLLIILTSFCANY